MKSLPFLDVLLIQFLMVVKGPKGSMYVNAAMQHLNLLMIYYRPRNHGMWVSISSN